MFFENKRSYFRKIHCRIYDCKLLFRKLSSYHSQSILYPFLDASFFFIVLDVLCVCKTGLGSEVFREAAIESLIPPVTIKMRKIQKECQKLWGFCSKKNVKENIWTFIISTLIQRHMYSNCRLQTTLRFSMAGMLLLLHFS